MRVLFRSPHRSPVGTDGAVGNEVAGVAFRSFEDHGRTVTCERGIRPDRAVCAPASESSPHAATRARGAGALEARRGPCDGTRRVSNRTESVWRRMANIVPFENVGLRYGPGPETLSDVSFTLEADAFYFLPGAERTSVGVGKGGV